MMGQRVETNWRIGILGALCCAVPGNAARAPKIPDDAPTCARPGEPKLFMSPMGEPFRASGGAAYPSAVWFAGADANHDGLIDRTEMIADASRFFVTLDRNHDGRLTPEDIAAYEQDVAPEIAIYQTRAGANGVRRSNRELRDEIETQRRMSRLPSGQSNYGGAMGAGRYAWLNIPQPVVSADADLNRVIDAGEFRAAASRRFDTLDRAASGRLKLTDLPKTPDQQAFEGPCKPLPVPQAPPKR